jgi:excisionase family DNA binding protein
MPPKGAALATTDRLLRPAEAARVLDVHPMTIKRWISDGSLDGVRLGDGPYARYRVRESDLDNFMRSSVPASDDLERDNG